MLNIGSLNRMFRSFKQIRSSLNQREQSLKALLKQGLSLTISTAFCGIVLFAGCVSNAYAADTVAADTVISELTQDGTSAVVAPAITDETDIAAEKIDQFAQAYLQVLELLSDREAEIPAAQTNADAIAIEQSIEKDAVQIIQNSGLSMPEYMQILELASQDNAFQDKILGRMDETGSKVP